MTDGCGWGRWRARWWLVAGFAALISGFFPQQIAIAAEETDEISTQIYLASYDIGAFSYHDSGELLWLAVQQGDLRLEIRRRDASRQDDKDGLPSALEANLVKHLLEQNGQGWTAILNGAGDETLNSWGEGWDFPPAGLGIAVAALTDGLVSGPYKFLRSETTWRAGQKSSPTQSLVIPSLRPGDEKKVGFRNQMASRGYGRGGDGEILQLRWALSPERGEPTLHVSASKWPGELKLRMIATYTARIAVPEVFVPLWPLSELVTIEGQTGFSDQQDK